VQLAKALGGSFKLVTLMPKTVREMTQLPRETLKMGTHKQIRETNEYTKYIVIIAATDSTNTTQLSATKHFQSPVAASGTVCHTSLRQLRLLLFSESGSKLLFSHSFAL